MNRTQVAYIQIQGWRSKIAEATVDGSTGNSSRTRTRLGHGVTAWIRTEPGRAVQEQTRKNLVWEQDYAEGVLAKFWQVCTRYCLSIGSIALPMHARV